MRILALFAVAVAAVIAAAPAQATGGLNCRTVGAKPIEINLVIGHVPGSPLAGVRLLDGGRKVPASASQWWLDKTELRLLLVAPSHERELLLRARRNGEHYDGSLWRGGKRSWVRCREG